MITESAEFREMVRRWHRQIGDGWQSRLEDVVCPQCRAERPVLLTTIAGVTRAGCQACRHTWTVQV